MLDQSQMMNHSTMGQPIPVLTQSQQVMNKTIINQLIDPSLKVMNLLQSQWRMNNHGGGYRMWPPGQDDQIMFKNQYISSSFPVNNRNWKGNNNNRKKLSVNNISNASNPSKVAFAEGYYPPTLNGLQQQNRLKPKRCITKKQFSHGGKSAPFAPRNTTSFLIRAKKAGGITSLVSPCPVTPTVLTTPVFSPSSEVLVDMAKEEWGVDGYGSMKGLIRLRSPDNDEDAGSSGSGESDVDQHMEVERRLDHDLSRFEMIYPSNGDQSSFVLENRVDDQDTHIAQLEEDNMMLKDRLFLMEREFSKLRTRLQSLEMGSRGYGRSVEGCNELLEDKSVDNNKESDNGEKGLHGVEV